jgi:hypothetical protein
MMLRMCSDILEVCGFFSVSLKCSLILVLIVLPVWPSIQYNNHRI